MMPSIDNQHEHAFKKSGSIDSPRTLHYCPWGNHFKQLMKDDVLGTLHAK